MIENTDIAPSSIREVARNEITQNEILQLENAMQKLPGCDPV